MDIAIVEISESHEECIYSQVSFLKDAVYSVSLFVHPKIEPQINDYKHLIDKVTVVDFSDLSFFRRLKHQRRLYKQLKKYDCIIFNTANSSKTVRNLCLLLKLSKVECIGILHDVKKLKKSFTQCIISYKIKKYFVLNDFLKSPQRSKNIKLESFYPIFFPKNVNDDDGIKKKHIWITIPGRVNFGRRDYNSLLKMLENRTIPKEVKFIILGNINTEDGASFMQSVSKKGLMDYFMFFRGYIPNRDFYSYIKRSNYIMPLLQKEGGKYLQNKITGTFNLAFAFKKKLFCDVSFSRIEDLKQNGVFYTEENFMASLLDILHRDKSKNYRNKKWDYIYQKNKYINFIKL